MHLQDIRLLYEFNSWAKARILGVAETLSQEQFTRDLNSSHGGVQGTLVHIMGAEEIWVRRWKGESPATFRKPEEFPSVDVLSGRWDMVEHEITGFCNMLKSEDDIARLVTYKDIKGNSYTMQLYRLMQHLVNHSTFHRGQVVTMLRQLGLKPAATDLVMFYRERGG